MNMNSCMNINCNIEPSQLGRLGLGDLWPELCERVHSEFSCSFKSAPGADEICGRKTRCRLQAVFSSSFPPLS